MESLASSLEAIRCCHCWRQDNRLNGFWGMNQAGNSYLPDLNKANRFPATRASWLPIFQLSRNPNFSNNCFVLKHSELEHSHAEFCFILSPPPNWWSMAFDMKRQTSRKQKGPWKSPALAIFCPCTSFLLHNATVPTGILQRTSSYYSANPWYNQGQAKFSHCSSWKMKLIPNTRQFGEAPNSCMHKHSQPVVCFNESLNWTRCWYNLYRILS